MLKVLPNANDRSVRNKMAEAESYVGLALALQGATAKDRKYGCERMKLARRIYSEIGNSPQVTRVDQDFQTGGCS
jgi:hypothetical protein